MIHFSKGLKDCCMLKVSPCPPDYLKSQSTHMLVLSVVSRLTNCGTKFHDFPAYSPHNENNGPRFCLKYAYSSSGQWPVSSPRGCSNFLLPPHATSSLCTTQCYRFRPQITFIFLKISVVSFSCVNFLLSLEERPLPLSRVYA